jgi:2-methylisocitrate lyase-like PEP mutase family enzyme
MRTKPRWADLLEQDGPLLLPVAHDALIAKLIERAGFRACQIGGFALEASHVGVPDIDLVHFGEMRSWVFDIVQATRIPVMVDASNGDGNIKSVARAVRGYEDVGASALFLEDQVSPKKCGHMGGKKVLPIDSSVAHLKVALDARRRDTTFIMARTDTYSVNGTDDVLARGVRYFDAGADGFYVEGVDNVDELRRIGREFSGRKLALSILEGGGRTPWMTPSEIYDLGFQMILYPTSLLFRIVRTIRAGLDDLRKGVPMGDRGIGMDDFLKIVDIEHWRAIEAREE